MDSSCLFGWFWTTIYKSLSMQNYVPQTLGKYNIVKITVNIIKKMSYLLPIAFDRPPRPVYTKHYRELILLPALISLHNTRIDSVVLFSFTMCMAQKGVPFTVKLRFPILVVVLKNMCFKTTHDFCLLHNNHTWEKQS